MRAFEVKNNKVVGVGGRIDKMVKNLARFQIIKKSPKIQNFAKIRRLKQLTVPSFKAKSVFFIKHSSD